MNIMGKKKQSIRTMSFNITPAGQERLDNGQGTGIELKILTHLSESGPLSVVELDKLVGIHDVYKTETFLMQGTKFGYISALKGQDI